MARLQRLAALICFLGLALSLLFRPSGVGDRPRATLGYPAPELNATDLTGRPVTLARLKWEPVLLNFWATWCGPCQAEMPELKRMQEAHPNLQIVGINLGESPERVAAYMREGGYDWPVVIDDGRLADAYGVISIPTSYFLTPTGVIGAAYNGPMSLGLMEELMARGGDQRQPKGVAWPSWLTGRLVPPVLPLGPLSLPTGPLFALLALVVADWLLRRGRGAFVPAGDAQAERMLGWLLGGALLGAKVAEILRSPSSFAAYPRLLIALPAGRWAVVGAVVGAGIGLWWALRRATEAERAELLNALGLPLLVGLAIAGFGSGEAALLRGVGWLLGAGLLWPRRGQEGAWLFAVTWAGAVFCAADLAVPATITQAFTPEQVIGGIIAGLYIRLADAKAARSRLG